MNWTDCFCQNIVVNRRIFFRSFKPTFMDAGPVQILPALRILTALEDILGSLGPQINAVMSKALALDNARIGASNCLLENEDVVCIIDMVKEKLSGQLAAGKKRKRT